VDTGSTWAILDRERAVWAELADSLTPEQWDHPSLCTAWRVRDVAGHVAQGGTTSSGQLLLMVLKYGFRINTMLEREAIKTGAKSPDELRALLRSGVGSRVSPPGAGPRQVLLDVVVHGQDVRRPLGLQRTFPAELLTEVLDETVRQKNSLMPGKKRSAGLRLRATDVEWEHGDGPEVSGPGEALLMAVSGRAAALDDLSGPGLDTLRSRMGG
jgi:uncharacterized protein (TIGR03083 family)